MLSTNGAMQPALPHRYRAYGLAIDSALPLPELFAEDAAENDADIAITLGTVPEAGPDTAQRIGPFVWATPEQFWLCIPGIARFRIAAGQKIVIDRDQAGDMDGIRAFLLGTALGVLLAQRRHLMLHGNAIRVGEGCVVCVGPSGMGKSTLAAGFHRRGFPLLTDDLVMVDDHRCVTPGLPRIKLWADTTQALAIDTAPLRRIRPKLEKFSYPVPAGFADTVMPVHAVYTLAITNGDIVTIEPLAGFAKFNEVRSNIYRPQFVEAMGQRSLYLSLCARLAADIRVARIARPARGFTVDRVIDTILDDLRATR